MSASDDDIKVRIAGDLADINKSLRDLKKQTRDSGRAAAASRRGWRQLGTQLTSLRRRVNGLAAGLTGGIAAFLSIRAAIRGVGNALNDLEQVDRQSTALGTTAERFQELLFTFREFQLDADDVSDALSTLADRARDALDGTQSFIDDFALLGVSVDDLRGKRPAELFDLIAERVASIEDPAQRTAGVVRTFGDDLGRRLNPLLLQGAAGLDRFAAQAREAGAVIDDELVESGARAAAEFRNLRRTIGLQFVQAVAQNAEELEALATSLTNVAINAARGAVQMLRFFGVIDEAEQYNELLRRRVFLEQQIATFEDRAGRIRRERDPQRQRLLEQAAEAREELAELDRQIAEANERRRRLERSAQLEPITVTARRLPVPGGETTTAADGQAEAARAAAQLERDLEDVRRRLAAFQGDVVENRAAELEAEFEDLLERLVEAGDEKGQQLVRELIDVELARTRLEQLGADYERTLADMARAEQSLQVQTDAGVISEREARRQIIELHRETAAEIEDLIPKMERLAAATGDEAAVARIADMRLELEKLGATGDVVAREMQQNFRDGGESAFADFISGASTARDALLDFVDTMRRQISQLIAERLFDRLFQQSGGRSGTGFFGNLAAAFLHEGGIAGVDGRTRRVPAIAFAGAPRLHSGGFPGLKSNEIPAILEQGEGVVSRRDMQRGPRLTPVINFQVRDYETLRRESPTQIAATVRTMLERAGRRNG